MALSNWAVLSYDSDYNIGDGIICSPKGAQIKIHKNWLSVHDPDMWCPGRRFVEPVVAHIHSGMVSMSGFEIFSARGKNQESIFCHIGCHETRKVMVGIGCYAYYTPYEKILASRGLSLDQYPPDAIIVESSDYPKDKETFLELVWRTDDGEIKIKRVDYDNKEEFQTKYVGVMKETHNEFLNWLENEAMGYKTIEDKKWLKWIKKTEIQGLNQGALYIAKALAGEEDAL